MNKQFLGLALTFLGLSATAFGADPLRGTPIGSDPQSAPFAFDGNPQSGYSSSRNTYAWVGLDLGSPHVISEVKWTPPAGREDALLLGVFQGATTPDFLDAVPIAFISDSSMRHADVNCSRGFRYVRLVGPVNSFCQVAEIEFYGQQGNGDDSRLCQITNLPTVVVNTLNGDLPYDKEHEIACNVIIISKDGTDVLQKSAGIRERGNMSRTFPKKPYRIKFDKKQNVLDAPAKAKKWTLINNYGDKTLMRNMLGFDIAKMVGMAYVPYIQPVDVVVNGDYKGCYQLCDQVEVNEGRVDIDEMTPDDNYGEALTGGYLVEVDSYAYSEPVWFSTREFGIPVTIKSPDDDEITDDQRNYIEDYFNMMVSKAGDTDPETGLESVFDIHSFVQHMLVNEFVGNTDTYWSVNMYKHRGNPKIYTGPVWDLDLGFDNDNPVYPVVPNSGDGYLWETHYSSSAGGMKDLARQILHRDDVKEEILNVWSQTRDSGFSIDWVAEKVNEYSALLSESQRLNFLRWPMLNVRVHGNPKVYGSYEAELDILNQYTEAQMPHLDKVIGYVEGSHGTNGIAAPIIDNASARTAEYFTLTGLRVEGKLSPGIYVEVKGNARRKIMVK